MKNVFEFLINTGVESLEMVADAEKKATICAELAKAIAQSGLLSPMITVGELTPIQESEEKPKKASAKKGKSSAKDALKPEASKVTEAPAPIEEEPVEAPQEPVAQEPVAEAPAAEPVMEDEWTEEMQTVKAEQLGLLQAYCEAWGEDYVYGDCLGAFSEGVFTGGENVRPSNIDGFVVYLQELASQFAQE